MCTRDVQKTWKYNFISGKVISFVHPTVKEEIWNDTSHSYLPIVARTQRIHEIVCKMMAWWYDEAFNIFFLALTWCCSNANSSTYIIIRERIEK